MAGFRINCRWRDVILSGVTAGIASTLTQILLWLIFTDDLPSILYRDARLTAAIVLGGQVLPPPASFDTGVMLTATLIHFMLSITYAALLAFITARVAFIPALWAGIGFGISLYMLNLYGFTAIFPWFAQTRGWITLAAHGVFGVSAILVCRRLNFSAIFRNARCGPDGH